MSKKINIQDIREILNSSTIDTDIDEYSDEELLQADVSGDLGLDSLDIFELALETAVRADFPNANPITDFVTENDQFSVSDLIDHTNAAIEKHHEV